MLTTETLTWTPTEQHLPDADTTVIGWIDYDDGTAEWATVWLDEDGWHDAATGGTIAGTVTHWAEPVGPLL